MLLKTKEEAVEVWDGDIASRKRNMSENWLEEERKIGLKANEILRVDFKEPQCDLIIMLSKAFDKTDYRHFHPWIFHYMTTILIGKKYFDWA